MVLGGRDHVYMRKRHCSFLFDNQSSLWKTDGQKREKLHTAYLVLILFFSETTLSNVSRRFPLNSMKLSCMGEYNPINESSFIEHELCVSQSHFSNWEDSKDNSRRICLSSKSMLLIFSRMNYFPLDLWGNF